ncbi:unnamed protein product [Closterium sp. NIES-64]|nr:unnamed protein product [Closterium sp. NIES-64]
MWREVEQRTPPRVSPLVFFNASPPLSSSPPSSSPPSSPPPSSHPPSSHFLSSSFLPSPLEPLPCPSLPFLRCFPLPPRLHPSKPRQHHHSTITTAPSAQYLAIAHLWEQLSKARLLLAEAMCVPCPSLPFPLSPHPRTSSLVSSHQPQHHQCTTAPSAKYLAIAHLWEQLSKARLHLAEAMALARHWGRILVLPRVGSSRIGGNYLPRGTLPACAYFNTELIGRFVPWVREEFLSNQSHPPTFPLPQSDRHTAQNASPPLLFLFCNLYQSSTHHPLPPPPNQSDSHTAQNAAALPDRPARAGLVEHLSLPPRLLALVAAALHHQLRRPRVVTLVTADCRGPKGAGGGGSADEVHPHRLRVPEEVAVLMKFTRLGVVLGVHEHIAYAPHLHRLASSFASQHLQGGGRYMAAHWRVEKAMMSHRSPVQMHQCVQGLLRDTAVWWLQERERQGMVARGGGGGGGGGEKDKVPVFMATDLTPENQWLSGTAHLDQHHRDVAFHAVKELFSRLQPSRLESFLPGLQEADIGVQAILDKLLCIKAAVFLYPPPSCRNYAHTGSGSAVADEICWWRERQGSGGGNGKGVAPCRMWSDGR